MKVKLPKELKGIKFSRVFTVDMNSFDINMFLPTLFHTILAGGRGKVRRTNDPEKIQQYIETLALKPDLQGFDDQIGRRVLERLVRTTLITTGAKGRSKKGEQITSIVPYSLLAHKPGFPAESSPLRGADVFIYQALREKMGRDDRSLQQAIKLVFGRGVIIGNMPNLGGAYDGATPLDTITRLSVAFLDGFKDTTTNMIREPDITAACPELVNEMGEDLLTFLFKFYEHMPSQALTYNLLALVNFELFIYTLKLVYAVNALVRDPETLPAAMRDALEPSPPQLYLDFTQNVRGRSHEMARECVRRDIEALQQFLSSNLLLRLLDSYVVSLRRNAQRKAKIDAVLDGNESGPLYLQRLLLLLNEPSLSVHFEAQALHDEERIREENRLPEESGVVVNEDDLNWLDDITASADSDIERVVSLLAEGQRDSALQHYVSWYWSVGGMKEPHGLLAGTVKSRASWRYAPANDLLAALVQVAAARLSKQGLVEPVRLQEFLRFLETHYGILIDRPPDMFKGAEYIAAAHENLRAMQNRLRQMGIFRDLSDDFTVQQLHPPYAQNTANHIKITKA